MLCPLNLRKLKLLTPCLSRVHLVLVRPLPTMGRKWLPNSEGASSYTNSNVAPSILPKSGGGATSPLLPPFTYTPALHQSLEEIH